MGEMVWKLYLLPAEVIPGIFGMARMGIDSDLRLLAPQDY